MSMKLSVSLPGQDVAFLDEYARRTGMPSRSAAVQRAVKLLRAEGLEAEYAEAFTAWDASEDAELWDRTVSDGLDDATR